AWKGVSSGGPECPLVYLCQQHAGKIDLHPCYQRRNHDCSVPRDMIISFCRRHPVTHQQPEELGHKITLVKVEQPVNVWNSVQAPRENFRSSVISRAIFCLSFTIFASR
ncbi:hypothetical protein H5410_032439, partial [Solanum commersonii]